MTDSHFEMSPADVGDRHRRYGALAMLALGAMYASAAIQRLVDPGVAAFLNAMEIGLIVVAVGLLVPVVTWKFRAHPHDDRHLYVGQDGFVADTLARAIAASWLITFLFLVSLVSSAERFGEMPPKFFLQCTIAVMLGVSSTVFLFLDRTPADSDLEDRSNA